MKELPPEIWSHQSKNKWISFETPEVPNVAFCDTFWHVSQWHDFNLTLAWHAPRDAHYVPTCIQQVLFRYPLCKTCDTRMTRFDTHNVPCFPHVLGSAFVRCEFPIWPGNSNWRDPWQKKGPPVKLDISQMFSLLGKHGLSVEGLAFTPNRTPYHSSKLNSYHQDYWFSVWCRCWSRSLASWIIDRMEIKSHLQSRLMQRSGQASFLGTRGSRGVLISFVSADSAL